MLKKLKSHIWSPVTASGLEMEQTCSYSPAAFTGLMCTEVYNLWIRIQNLQCQEWKTFVKRWNSPTSYSSATQSTAKRSSVTAQSRSKTGAATTPCRVLTHWSRCHRRAPALRCCIWWLACPSRSTWHTEFDRSADCAAHSTSRLCTKRRWYAYLHIHGS